MSDLGVSRNNSLLPITPNPGRTTVTRVEPNISVTPLSAPISPEAQQLARSSSRPQVPTTVATHEDIASIRSEIESITTPLPTVVNEHAQLANSLQDSPLSKDTIRSAIAFLGDHPQAQALLQRLTSAGEDRGQLLSLRNDVVDTLRSQGREVSSSRQQGHSRVDSQMSSERGPVDNRWAIRRAVIGGMDRSTHATEQQQRLGQQSEVHLRQAGEFTRLANRLQDNAPTVPSLRSAIAMLGDNPQANALKARLAAAQNDPVAMRSLRNDTVDALRSESRKLTEVGNGEREAIDRIGHLSGEGLEELVANVSLATSVVSSTNSIVRLATGTTSGFMGTAASAVGVGFGGLQIASELVSLRRNVGRMSEALSRRDQAQLVLAPASQRSTMIRNMEAEIQTLREPRWYRTRSGREADIAKLEAKIGALRSMGSTEATPQARAIAQQVVDSTSIGFKALRIAKNVAGIAAGAIAIAVAVGALATPVGWIAAGVVLAATAGLWIYNKHQTSSRETKIENLMQNRTQIAHQIVDLESSPASRNPESPQGRALTSLRDLQQKNLVQLLTVSPQHAANEIISGLKATPPDPQMLTLATQVLNVPVGMTRAPFSATQENELREYLMRGIPMQPKL
ncbi:MAG TPA: hypothetical protein V6D23_17830 [Candidatus Obscuribacterales bacterium]